MPAKRNARTGFSKRSVREIPRRQRRTFTGILGAAPDLPAVIYNSPYYGFETRADLFFELRREHPNLVGFKEFGGADALDRAAEHITHADEELLLNQADFHTDVAEAMARAVDGFFQGYPPRSPSAQAGRQP